jgi:hypothetical protein
MKRIFQSEHHILIAILLLALVNGLLYIFIVPPWQHYDEPNHFEYVWWLVKHNKPPETTDYDTDMRHAVAQSMIDHGFFEGNTLPLPDLTTDKPYIGQYSQAGEPVLYYLLASLPLRVLPTDDVTTQMYAARMVSLVLLLITILAGWGLTAEITPPRHPLRYLVPLTMALLPSFVDLMTAVNNDSSAVVAFSLFLWGSTCLIRRGFSVWTFLFVLFTVGLCIFTKRTALIAVPLSGIVILFAVFRGKYRKIAWGLMILAGVVGVFAVFSWGDAALWYHNTPQNIPNRNSTVGVLGDSALHIQIQPDKSTAKLVQILPVEAAKSLSEQPLTLGAWIWASQPLEVNSAQFSVLDQLQTFGRKISVDETPRFYAFHFTPTGDTGRAWVILEPGKKTVMDEPVDIFYDGVVLAEGDFPIITPPELSADGSEGTWDGIAFKNLVRNGSAENSWLSLRPWVETLASRIFSDYAGQEKFSLTLYSLVDWPSTGWYYEMIAKNLFRTFWAKFGWGHVPLIGAKPYRHILLPFTVLAVLGVGLGFWQRRRRLSQLPWDTYFFLGIALGVVWGMALLRGTSYLFIGWAGFVVARYAYPAIVPTTLVFATGWLVLLEWIEHRFSLPDWGKYLAYLSGFLALNIYSLISISNFYH